MKDLDGIKEGDEVAYIDSWGIPHIRTVSKVTKTHICIESYDKTATYKFSKKTGNKIGADKWSKIRIELLTEIKREYIELQNLKYKLSSFLQDVGENINKFNKEKRIRIINFLKGELEDVNT